MKRTGIADKGKTTLRRVGLVRLGQEEVQRLASLAWFLGFRFRIARTEAFHVLEKCRWN